jgi:hypothetical protein
MGLPTNGGLGAKVTRLGTSRWVMSDVNEFARAVFSGLSRY